MAVSLWLVLLCRVGTHDLCVRLRQRLHRQDRSTTDALPLDTLVCPCRATYPSDTSDTSDCSDLLRYLRSLTSNLPSISNLQVGVVLSERVVRHSRKKKLVESLVVSGSCITFALATQKNGSSEVSGEP